MIPASLLHDVGPAQGRSAGERQREILLKLGCRTADIEQICGIIECLQSGGTLDSANFRIVHDADCLTGIGAHAAGARKSRLLTDSARTIAAATAAGK